MDSSQPAERLKSFVSESLTPTLAWELTLAGGDPYGGWSETIGEADITYDIDVFDNHTLVYDEKQVPDPTNTLAWELEPCKTYRWSVRPAYQTRDSIRYGDWMRAPTAAAATTVNGIQGRKASTAPAYIQDFAALKIHCRAR